MNLKKIIIIGVSFFTSLGIGAYFDIILGYGLEAGIMTMAIFYLFIRDYLSALCEEGE